MIGLFYPLILFVLSILYAALAAVLLIGTYRLKAFRSRERPSVSVVVAARDEEKHLPKCLEALLCQTYPRELYEIIVVDDRSCDETGVIVEGYGARNPQVKGVTVSEEPRTLSGKQNALIEGLSVSSGTIFVNTDADCVVPETWIEELVARFDSETGLVAGMSVAEGRGWFYRLQALDLLFLQTVAGGFCGLGKPMSCIGNNLAYRREAYESCGGFEKIGFSVTEDTALLRAIHGTGRWKVVFQVGPRSAVSCGGTDSLGAFFRQRKRWMVGGYKTEPFLYITLQGVFWFHLLMILSIPLLGFIRYPSLIAASWILAFLSDGMLLLRGCSWVRRRDLLRYLPLYEIFYMIYTVVLGFARVGGRQVHWKGRTY